MRKKLTLLLAALAGLTASAQTVTSYSLSNTSGTFTPLTGATQLESGTLDGYNNKLYDGTNSAVSTVSGAGISLGFNFTFGNETFTNFVVNTNGYIVLRNEGDADFDAGYSASSLYYDAKNVIGSYAAYASSSDSTSISYKIDGTEGNHVLTVQFLNVNAIGGYSEYGSTAATFSEQIKLYEDGGKVEFVYGPVNLNSDSYQSASIYAGLYKDAANNDVIVKDGQWSDNATSTSAYTAMSFGQYTASPEVGTTLTFTAPQPCEKPLSQPSALTLTSTSSAISGSFSKSDADQYLVLLSNGELNADAVPADGQTYSAGDSLGNAAVIQMSADTTFSTTAALKGNTEYTVTVFAANTACSGGPDYLLDNALTANVTTLPGAPDSLALVSADTTSLVLSAKAVEGSDVLVAFSDHFGTTEYGGQSAEGAFGTPSGNLKVGDEIDGGGKVIAVGGSSNAISVDGLQANKLYHFKAWTKKDSSYSSSALTTSAFTAAKVPWTADLNVLPKQIAPLGWKVGPGHSDRGWVVDQDNSYYSTDKTPFIQNYGFEGDADGVSTWVETPDIYLSNLANRLIFELRLVGQSGYYSTTTYKWADNDSVTIQATTDGKTYKTLAAYGKDALPEFTDQESFKKLYTTFYDLAGQKVRLRIGFLLHDKATITLRNIKIEEKGQCDYPVNVTVPDSSIVGDTAVIDWTSQGDENAWEVQYKKSSDESWQNAVKVTTQEHPFTISGLEGKTNYDVRVRALCSKTEHSSWSDAAQFRSGLAVPFSEVFADEDSDPGWKAKTGKLATPSVLTDGGLWAWAKGYYSSGAVYHDGYSDVDSADDWYISPKFNVGNGNRVDTASIKLTFNDYSYYIAATDYHLYLVVAADGENFNAADTIIALNNSELESGRVYSAPLTGYKGNIRLGVLLSYTGGNMRSITLDNVTVTKGAEQATAISTIRTDVAADSEKVYSIDGRLISDKFDRSVLRPGLYIVGHKKVIVK